MTPRTVIGVPLYNHASKLPEALESLLIQTNPDLAIVLCDDGSADATPEIVARYAAVDPRVIYRRNPERLGYIGNARRCFETARQLFPEAEFFAWGSDHDIWHPRWHEALVDAMDANPGTVLACPLPHRIDEHGQIVFQSDTSFDSVELTSVAKRFRATLRGVSAGNMVYGLMRASAVERAGVMRYQLLPDRLLLVEMSISGSCVHVPEFLWYRRYFGVAATERQIRASWFGKPPFHLKLWWWLAHSGSLIGSLALHPQPDLPIGRLTGLRLALSYARIGMSQMVTRWVRRSVVKGGRRVMTRLGRRGQRTARALWARRPGGGAVRIGVKAPR